MGTSAEGRIPQGEKVEFRGIQGEEMDWQDDGEIGQVVGTSRLGGGSGMSSGCGQEEKGNLRTGNCWKRAG